MNEATVHQALAVGTCSSPAAAAAGDPDSAAAVRPNPEHVKTLTAVLRNMTENYPKFAKLTPGASDGLAYRVGELWRKGIDGTGTTIALIEGWDDPGMNQVIKDAKILISTTPADSEIAGDAVSQVAPPELIQAVEHIGEHHLADAIPISDNTDESSVPDITMDAQKGASEAAALFAGVLAPAAQLNHGSVGPVNDVLYRVLGPHGPQAGIADVVSGDNSVPTASGDAVLVPGFAAGAGFDVAGGWGTIDPARRTLPPGRHTLTLRSLLLTETTNFRSR